jgi:hypothetical protein
MVYALLLFVPVLSLALALFRRRAGGLGLP